MNETNMTASATTVAAAPQGGGATGEAAPPGAAIMSDITGWTPERARAEIDAWGQQISGRPNHAYFVKSHPLHAATVARMAALHELAASAQAVGGTPGDVGATAVHSTPQGAPGAVPAPAAWTPEQARLMIQARQAELADNPGDALLNKMHPGHEAALAEWTRLHEAAFPQADEQASSEGEPPITEIDASNLVNNHVNLSKVTMDGKPLTSEDTAVSRIMIAQSVRALDLPRHEAGALVNVLNQSFRGTVSIEQATAALHKEFGEAGTRQVIADAKRVLAVIDAKGIRATDALDLSGAGNNPELIKHLARLAPRYAGRRA